MKLNPDCIRDILIDVEENTSFSTFYDFLPESFSTNPRLSKYDIETILYHIKQCELTGYFSVISWNMANGATIVSLSPKGHHFLADIRSDSVWNNVKEVSKKVGSNSLQAISQIATGVITEIIKLQLGITSINV